MRYRSISRTLIVLLVIAIVAMTFPSPSQAVNNVAEGLNLYETQRSDLPVGPTLGVVRFVGDPIRSFDFGMGPVNTFNTDTIIQRKEAARGEEKFVAAIEVEMVARHLKSEQPVDFGNGPVFLFLTLQRERDPLDPKLRSLGCMIIRFCLGTPPCAHPPLPTPEVPQPVHGTFDSFINMAFDIRAASTDGDILISDTITLEAFNVPWSHHPPPMAFLIDGVNRLLGKCPPPPPPDPPDPECRDFWPAGTLGPGGEFETELERLRSALRPSGDSDSDRGWSRTNGWEYYPGDAKRRLVGLITQPRRLFWAG